MPMGGRGHKRPLEVGAEDGALEAGPGPCELRLPGPLAPREASAVEASLEQWGRLRNRVEALRPTLQEEDRLMQEILDHGLGGKDRKTLRRLASGDRGGGDADEEFQQVAASIGDDREQLQDILFNSQRKLLELSTATTPENKKELLVEMDIVLDELRRAQDAAHSELMAAKERHDLEATRKAGRALNDLRALMRRLDGERRSLTKNSDLAALLVTVCRRVLPVRQIDPLRLLGIAPSYAGYMKILDFYFFSDASLYCFGEHYSGPNWFTRLKRNIAILAVRDDMGNSIYNGFAVSGEHKTPGAPLAPLSGPLVSIEAEDENGRVFDRRHDAEFKLLTDFCTMKQASLRASAVLWSKKPLCRSCAGAVRQVRERLPYLGLDVVVGGNSTFDATAGGPPLASACACEPSSSSSMVPHADTSEGGTSSLLSTALGGCANVSSSSSATWASERSSLPAKSPDAACDGVQVFRPESGGGPSIARNLPPMIGIGSGCDNGSVASSCAPSV